MLLTDQTAYNAFFHSLEQVARMNHVADELKKGNVELARANLAREATIGELRTQCRIIRGTELAAAQEKLEEARKREREILQQRSPAALLDRLAEAAQDTDNESEELNRRFLAGEVDLNEFIRSYRKIREVYHTRHCARLAALDTLTSST